MPAELTQLTSLVTMRADGNPLDAGEAVRYNMIGLQSGTVGRWCAAWVVHG